MSRLATRFQFSQTIRSISCIVALTVSTIQVRAGDVSFDVPPTSIAVPAAPETVAGRAVVGQAVTMSFRLSSLVSGQAAGQVDRIMVRCLPRNADWRVLDYTPRTEAASDMSGPIEVKKVDEATDAFGLSLDASHGHFVQAHAGGDHGKKQSETLQYQRHAPMQAVTAAGTIDRGRGVYFKLLSTAQQILEGEKCFSVTFDVPADFRSGLIDLQVTAYGKVGRAGKFAGIPMLSSSSDAGEVFAQNMFAVAVYAEGDPVAKRLAGQYAMAEQRLRYQASQIKPKSSIRSVSGVIRHVAAKIDPNSEAVSSNEWLPRLLFADADPYTDPVIRKLPADLRADVLELCDVRRDLSELKTRAVAKWQVDPKVLSLESTAAIQSDRK